MTLPKLSIAAKLYAIFALLATTTVALALVAVINARSHAALTDEFESANAGSLNVERVNGLIYAVRDGVARHLHVAGHGRRRQDLRRLAFKFNEQIATVIADWQSSGRAATTPKPFSQFAVRIRQFHEFRPELARHRHRSPARRRPRLGRQRMPTVDVRNALNKDLETLGRSTPSARSAIYAEIDDGIDEHRAG